MYEIKIISEWRMHDKEIIAMYENGWRLIQVIAVAGCKQDYYFERPCQS